MHTFLRWLARIHIGHWPSAAIWAAAVERRCHRQWKRPPAVPLTDATGLAARLLLCGRQGGKRLRFWHRASLALALPSAAAAASLRPPEGLPPGVEWGVAAFAALRGGQSHTERWIHDLAEAFLRRAAEAGGTLPYSAALPQLRLVDTLWMVCPFLFLYGAQAQDARCTDLAKRQLQEYLAQGLHPLTGLPAHSFAPPDGTPAGVYGWGRGCAFLFLALTQSAAALDAAAAERTWLVEQALAFSKALLRIKLPGGGWPWLPLAEDRPEASATAMLGYGFALLAELLPDAHMQEKSTCLEAAKQAQNCLMPLTRRDGAVDFAQGDTQGIGLYSTRREPLPLAQAFSLCLAKALQKLEERA
ncbi:MAG: glycoside hydrolase family 88 protein [Oscillospiraceae bacterium]|jgi:unsaturated rhamnogalacturonyl hydrolase|nr:glycoside hydrolase family 88 protein [Oscillospiraceae bacterium]